MARVKSKKVAERYKDCYDSKAREGPVTLATKYSYIKQDI